MSGTFHARVQLEHETLADYCHAIMRLYQHLENAATDGQEWGALELLRGSALEICEGSQ